MSESFFGKMGEWLLGSKDKGSHPAQTNKPVYTKFQNKPGFNELPLVMQGNLIREDERQDKLRAAQEYHDTPLNRPALSREMLLKQVEDSKERLKRQRDHHYDKPGSPMYETYLLEKESLENLQAQLGKTR